jgi:hypothetical protein
LDREYGKFPSFFSWLTELTVDRALREGGEREKDMRLVHTNRHGLDLSKRLFENRIVDSEDVGEMDLEVSDEQESGGAISYERKLAPGAPGRVNFYIRTLFDPTAADNQTALTISSFYLSTLPTISSRQVHLRQLLASSPSYLVLVDRSSPQGWQAISEARSYILSLSESSETKTEKWHLIAPCPHEYECPLADGKDRCSFSQKLQRPSFTRKTKHANRGEEDVNYTYLVIGKGPRPDNGTAFDSLLSDIGRLGGVGKEVLEKEAIKREGKSELKEVEGGEFEMVSLADTPIASSDNGMNGQNEDQVEQGLRKEAYMWPRVVAPPMKRAGHVILDTCFPDGASLPSLPLSYRPLINRQYPATYIRQISFEASLLRCPEISMG